MKHSINRVPKELIEPLGNLIRKTAYTQLRTVRLVGLSISDGEHGNAYLATTPISGTTTTLDIIIKLVDCLVNNEVQNSVKKNTETELYVKTVTFTDLKQALSSFVDVTNLPDDLLITSKPHVLKLYFMMISKDMNANSLTVLIPEGATPIPCSVIRNGEFKLDYSKKDEGVLYFEIADLDAELIESINALQRLSIN